MPSRALVLALAFAFPALAAAQSPEPPAAPAASAADSAAIRATALDYVEGWYTGDAARMERALHPERVKRIIRVDSTGNSERTTADCTTRTRRRPSSAAVRAAASASWAA